LRMPSLKGARIYIAPCGLGYGHVTRCHVIARELQRRECHILFSTYLEGVDYLRGYGYSVVESPSMSMETDAIGQIDLRRSAAKGLIPIIPRFLYQVGMELEYMRAYRPDLVISDTRLSPIFAARLLGLPVILILNQFQLIVPRSRKFFTLSRIADGALLTLIGWGWALSDVILVPDLPEPYTISLDSLRIPRAYRGRVRFIGAILPLQPSEVKGVEDLRRELDAEDRFLIYASISGPRKERLPLIETLIKIFEGFPDEFRVVMSMGMVGGGSKPVRRGPLTIIPWIEDRFRCLKACDLVVSRAGHETILQSICYGKPQILIPTPGHTEQYANARRARELGVAEVLEQLELSTERLLELVKRMLGDQGYLEKLGEMSSLIELGGGVKRALEAVKELLS